MKTTEAAKGKWKMILQHFDIPADVLDHKHHPCPVNGMGTDRFRFSDDNGSGDYFCACSQGGRGGFGILECKTERSFADLAREVDSIIGNTHDGKKIDKPPRFAERLRDVAVKARRSGYLESRGLEIAPGLRFAHKVEYFDDGNVVGTYPAMLGPVTRRGSWQTFHVTYLDGGRKADVPSVRKILPGGAIVGAGIELYPAAEEMGIAEGIESAISAKMLTGIPVHAAMNAGNMAKWDAPKIAKRVHIFADNDANFAGHAAAWTLAHRLACRGVEAMVRMPDDVGKDWNDILLERVSARRIA